MRSISLTSCFLKVLEKLILNRLYWLLESSRHPILSNSQFGFRKFRSCQDNLTTLTAAIHEGFAAGSPTVAVFVDIKFAFDNVLPHILMNDLLELQFSPKTVKFIENLISSRQVQFVIHGALTAPRTSRKGTPQGSVLSPTLFNMYLRKLEDQILP